MVAPRNEFGDENDRPPSNRVLYFSATSSPDRIDQVGTHQVRPDDNLSVVPGSAAALAPDVP